MHFVIRTTRKYDIGMTETERLDLKVCLDGGALLAFFVRMDHNKVANMFAVDANI